MYLLSACDNVMVLKVVLFIKKLLEVVFWVVPMGLIVMVSIDLLKSVIASKEDDMKKNASKSIKRVIYAMFLFLVPFIVNFTINQLSPEKVNYMECLDVTEAGIDDKIMELKAKCVGDDYWWSETTYQCKEKEVFDNTPQETYKPFIRNYSSSGSSSGTSIGNVHYYYQCDPNWKMQSYCSGGDNICDDGCGVTSLAMVATTLVDKKYNPSYVAEWMCSNKVGGTTGVSGTDTIDMRSDKVKEHFGLNVEILFEGGNSRTYISEQGDKILNAARSNKMIVLNVPNHYTVVTTSNECKNDEIYYYDVANISNNGCYTPKQLFDKTVDRNKWCTREGRCGWQVAYAYTKK